MMLTGNAATVRADVPEMPSGEMPSGEIPGGEMPSGEMPGGGGPGGGSSTSVSWIGATTLSTSGIYTGESYSSSTSDENALLIDGDGTAIDVTLTNPKVTKTAGSSDSAGDNQSFYGTNSAVLAKGNAQVTISGAEITTNTAGANGVFSYGGNGGSNGAAGDGTLVTISDSTITTTGNGSGGIMTTGGGKTVAKNLTITTSGGSSAPIRTDRGGGTVVVDGGTYTSNGTGSPVIYSTADVTVSNATLQSNASEGVCIEGQNSITLNNCALTANNKSKNGNAQYYDSIMIYQSQSGDAATGTSKFTMTGGSLTSQNGHVFHVTNTDAVITLKDAVITNQDSDQILLSVVNDGWSGAANVATLNAENQKLSGGIIVSNASSSTSTLTMNLSSSSVYTGAINQGQSDPGTVNLTIDSTSSWILDGDSYVTSLTNNGTITYGGHTLYVNGTAYTEANPYSGGVGTSTDTSAENSGSEAEKENESSKAAQDISEDTVKITVDAQTYTGKQLKPSVSVYDSSTKTTLKKGTDYTVSYGTNKGIGKNAGTVTVVGKGDYTGSKKISFTIQASDIKNLGIKVLSGRKIKVTAKKSTKTAKITGYQVAYRVKGKGSWKKENIVSAKTLAKVLKSLKKGKQYQVKVRTFVKVSKKTYYGSFSSVKVSGKVK